MMILKYYSNLICEILKEHLNLTSFKTIKIEISFKLFRIEFYLKKTIVNFIKMIL